MARMPLKEVDKVEILSLVDNTIDILMAGTPQAKRFPIRSDALTRESLVAEHGFAALVSASSSNTSESLLFDAGLSKHGLIHNMDVLEVRPKELRAIVLSHGHADHTTRTDRARRAAGRAQDAAATASGCVPRTKGDLSGWQ